MYILLDISQAKLCWLKTKTCFEKCLAFEETEPNFSIGNSGNSFGISENEFSFQHYIMSFTLFYVMFVYLIFWWALTYKSLYIIFKIRKTIAIQKQLKTSSTHLLLEQGFSSLYFHKFLPAGTPCSPGTLWPVCPWPVPARAAAAPPCAGPPDLPLPPFLFQLPKDWILPRT